MVEYRGLLGAALFLGGCNEILGMEQPRLTGSTGSAGSTGDTGGTATSSTGGTGGTGGASGGTGGGTATTGSGGAGGFCGQPGYKCVFTRSKTTNGKLGGLDGADAFCQASADAAKLGGTFRAWLSDTTGSPSTRFTKHQLPYVRIDEVKVADSFASLESGSGLLAPIDVTETGGAPPSVLNFTATDSGGEFGKVGHCMNWTSSSDPTGSWAGNNTAKGGTWTSVGSLQSCGGPYSLYCFEQ
jgi:hypothetical protein